MYDQISRAIDEIGDHIFALSLIFGALVTLHVRVVRPIVRAARTVHDRWGDISQHEEAIGRIEVKVDTVESKVNHIEGIATETVGRVVQIEAHVGLNNNGTGNNV